ncbi:putative glycolipid-binding domain-containing protein [Mesobacillus zeae]|uniref:Glycolipid-binding domain-containing protein n=1 Tax=Mesobacillus zeae TaxID=1917180 RepID=A0A398BE22_9BACI|nr:putative glycolipid-binding domain-containing protein [Mesobacillus zeae]RID88455.1 hypothetical protein D1970_01775 [Mesobacillus zeae]
MMKKTIVWENRATIGSELMEISFSEDGISIESTVIGIKDTLPYLIKYDVGLDENWVFKQLDMEILNFNESLHITSNGRGKWFDKNGKEMIELQGAIDIDISCTPFTNSLPINRLKWGPETSRDFEMVYISVPDLSLKKVKQSYKLVNSSLECREFHYKSGNFQSDIIADSDGLVIEYPGLFTRKY